MNESFKKRIGFYYDDVMGTFSFAPGHPVHLIIKNLFLVKDEAI